MKHALTFALIAGASSFLAGCNDNSSPPKPDNSGVNTRDRNGSTLTPPDQAEGTESDRKITAELRSSITGDTGFSINARNIKIVTANGVVTLRGPVDNQAEKDRLGEKAKAIAGVHSVDNQLEVKNP